jgi:hypothetical protein
MNEADHISATIDDIRNQYNPPDFKLIVVVNQPKSYFSNPAYSHICQNNQTTLDWLKTEREIEMEVIDRCTYNNAWSEKEYGVGWARKTAMDYAAALAKPSDIILSLDADTRILPDYLNSIAQNFRKNSSAVGMAVPYYHQLTNNSENDRAILRYEIYMRTYALNMWRISNPYSYTAIGSGMACTAKAYKAVRGLSPKLSGEDFYFLLKLKKFGELITWNSECVYPSARYSDRVFFGTGPALIKGKSGDWSSYPVYHFSLFDEVAETFSLIPCLFDDPYADYPLKNYLQSLFKDHDFLLPLVRNSKNAEGFFKLFSQKVDALRILQYLKEKTKNGNYTDHTSIMDYLRVFHGSFYSSLSGKINYTDFFLSEVETLNLVRNYLFERESEFQKHHWYLQNKEKCKLLQS